MIMNYARSDFNEKPLIDKTVGMQVYLHEGGGWVQGHFHKEIEVVYAIEGVVSLEVNHEIVHLRMGESMILKPDEVHSFIASPGSIRLVIQFTLENLSKSIYQKYKPFEIENILEHLNLKSNAWEKEDQEKFHALLFQIQEEFNQHDVFREVRLLNLSSQVMMILLNDTMPQSTHSVKRRTKSNLSKLQEIYDYIEKNYQKDLSLEEIADHVNYNKHYLTRYFKSMTGMSVFTFLNDYRLNQAKWLLLTTEKSMDDIAYEAGFQSTKRFHHVFKEVMGTSPLQYQKETKRGK